MKKIFLLILLFSVLFISCEKEELVEESEAVCRYENLTFRASPDGKVLEKLTLGEKVSSLGEIQKTTKGVEYIKIKRIDGKIGWANSSYIVVDAIPGVIKEENNLFALPELNSIKNDKLPRLQILCVSTVNGNDEFAMISWWDSSKNKLYDEQYIKKEAISYSVHDVAVARLFVNVNKEKDINNKLEILTTAKNNFKKSMFMEDIENAINTLSKDVDGKDSDVLTYETESFNKIGTVNDKDVNLRETPTLKGKKIAHLIKGEQLGITERLKEKEKIDNMFDYWYKVKTKSGLIGWAYGVFLDIKE